MSIGFASSREESQSSGLEVLGKIPLWLSGTLIRTGPSLYEIGEERLNHWFDGLAKLQRFAFHDGVLEYNSRFLKSNA